MSEDSPPEESMGALAEGKVRVGPAGWSYKDWEGIVYPPGMPRSLHPLAFLAPFFDTVEINTSFYRPLNPKHGAGWVKRVEENPRFLFTVKLWERFTHDRGAWPGEAEIRLFRDGIAPLHEAGKLGAVLIQFPWSFKRVPENRQWLARVLEEFSDYPLALELRHASWDRPEVYAGLAARKVAFCNIDQPLFAQSIEPSANVTAPLGYIRLHGRNAQDWFREEAGRDDRYNYLYTGDELQPWIEKINQMKKRVNDLFVTTNNHFRGQAIVNALEIQAALGRVHTALPNDLLQYYPRLKKLLHEEK
ncbi:MAG TPA: DUF72 domain-containing protein [Candidatus Hydrogenedentes bacterium]|nr:DUF72 domain-containing protein [Candidatus Hydrogenedentota bacterium]